MKRTGLNIICSLLLAGGMCACTATPKQTEEIKWSERMAQSEMQRFPEPWMIEKAKKPRWGYTHGLVVKSMLEEWKHTGDTAYYNYAKIYADSLIDTDGKIKTMKYLSFNIDIGMKTIQCKPFWKETTGIVHSDCQIDAKSFSADILIDFVHFFAPIIRSWFIKYLFDACRINGWERHKNRHYVIAFTLGLYNL